MPIDEKVKNDVTLRLKRANGHLNAVIKMVENQEYCINVINQLKAVQSALEKASQVVLKNHLETCVTDAIKDGDAERVINELLEIYKRCPVGLIETDVAEFQNIQSCCNHIKEDNA